MKRVTLALASLLVALAVVPAADARVVQPPWVVVRWDYLGDCKVWRNDINGPWGPGWRPVMRPIHVRSAEMLHASSRAGGL